MILLNTLAGIPGLDWKGTEFLMFYLVSLTITGLWSWLRARRAMENFVVPDRGLPQLTDPSEIAYLAGGPQRVVQLAVVRLVSEDQLVWKNSKNAPGLVRIGSGTSAVLNDLEREVVKSAGSFGDTGMPLRDVANAIGGNLGQIERRLAVLGLRPTASERTGAAFRAVLPLIFLIGIGITKVFIGLSREKPVIFLLILLGVSLIAMMALMGRVPRLTKMGEEFLATLHETHDELEKRVLSSQAVSNQEAAIALSLLGPSCLVGLGSYLGIDHMLSKHLTNMGKSGGDGGCSSGGCGGGSGCGGGGCGGGCGGCGGGD